VFTKLMDAAAVMEDYVSIENKYFLRGRGHTWFGPFVVN
jgi:hypothetical protein